MGSIPALTAKKERPFLKRSFGNSVSEMAWISPRRAKGFSKRATVMVSIKKKRRELLPVVLVFLALAETFEFQVDVLVRVIGLGGDANDFAKGIGNGAAPSDQAGGVVIVRDDGNGDISLRRAGKFANEDSVRIVNDGL